jgi:transcriptional regulator of arginine metabolism
VNNHAAGDAIRRREELIRILRESSVRSQDELRRHLHSRGFPAAQPTLSRDLKELGVAKGPNGYVLPSGEVTTWPPLLPPDAVSLPERRMERLDRTVREFVLSAEVAGTLLVQRTPPADAHPVARAIDEAALPDIAGTISGDDTIFLALRSATSAQRLARRFQSAISPASRSPRLRGAAAASAVHARRLRRKRA